MTRRSILAVLAASPLLARDRRSAWQTDAGKRAIELRRQLRALNMYDEMAENWTEVERALVDGCEHFTHAVSRVECEQVNRDSPGAVRAFRVKRRLWRVLPISAPPNAHGYFVPWSQRILTTSPLVPDR